MSPVIKPWDVTLIVLLVVFTPTVVNPTGSTITLLLKSLYVSVLVIVLFGLTLIEILCGELNPWVDAVDTVTKFLLTSPVSTLWLVLKLWVVPDPTLLKKSVVADLWVLAIPTNVPVVPKPTLTVAIPIKLSSILATNTFWPSVKVIPTPTFVESSTIIPLPPVPGE